MYAKVTATPALRLRETPDGTPISRIPHGSIVLVIDWDSNDEWAKVEYQGGQGYALKEYLSLESDANAQAAFKEENAKNFGDSFTYSQASGHNLPYVVMQVTLKEKWLGTGSRNLTELEDVINHYAARGYRLHTMATSESGSKGGLLGDRIQATLVFERK